MTEQQTGGEAPTYWLAEHGDQISLWPSEREAMNECDEITRAGARGRCWDWAPDPDDPGVSRQIWVAELDDRRVGDAGGRVTPLSVQGTASPTEVDRLRAERDELLEELDGRGEEARERWIARDLEKTGLRSMDFRNGMSMEIEPAREMVAAWVGAARAMLGDAPNYSETLVEMVVKVAEAPERYAFVLQRVGQMTPHEARQQAEAQVKRLTERVSELVKQRDSALVDSKAETERLESGITRALDVLMSGDRVEGARILHQLVTDEEAQP